MLLPSKSLRKSYPVSVSKDVTRMARVPGVARVTVRVQNRELEYGLLVERPTEPPAGRV